MSKWEIISLVDYHRTLIDVEFPYKFDIGVTLSETPEWLKDDSISEYLSLYHRELLKDDEIKYILRREYEATALGERDTEWQGKTNLSKDDVSFELIKYTNMSLWITKPTAFGFSTVLHFEYANGEKILRYSFQDRKIYPHHRYVDDDLKKSDIKNANFISSKILG